LRLQYTIVLRKGSRVLSVLRKNEDPRKGSTRGGRGARDVFTQTRGELVDGNYRAEGAGEPRQGAG